MSSLKWRYLEATEGLSPVLHKLEHNSSLPRKSPFFTPSPHKTQRQSTQTGPGMLSARERKLARLDERDVRGEIERLQQHLRSNSTASRKAKSKALRKEVRPTTPYLNFEGLAMPSNLAVLAITRRQVIAEIRKQSIPGLKLAHLQERQEGLRPLESLSTAQATRLSVRRDMRSRSQFATSLYGLAALPRRSRLALQEALREVMPQGSRFTDQKLFSYFASECVLGRGY